MGYLFFRHSGAVRSTEPGISMCLDEPQDNLGIPGSQLTLRPGMTKRLRQPRDLASFSRQFQNVQAGIGAVDDVDIAALVSLDIVGLDRDLAAILAVDLDAALVGRRRDRWNEVTDLGRMIGIANIERANPTIEPGDERHLLVVDRRHAFVGGMRAKPSAALAEIAASFLGGVV